MCQSNWWWSQAAKTITQVVISYKQELSQSTQIGKVKCSNCWPARSFTDFHSKKVAPPLELSQPALLQQASTLPQLGPKTQKLSFKLVIAIRREGKHKRLPFQTLLSFSSASNQLQL